MSVRNELFVWLQRHGLEKWHSCLDAEHITVAHLSDITEEDLISVGMRMEPRRALMRAARAGQRPDLIGASGLQIDRAVELLAQVIVPGQLVALDTVRGRIADTFAPTGLAQEQRGLVIIVQSGLPALVTQGRPLPALDLIAWIDRLCHDHCLDRSKATDLASIWNRALGGSNVIPPTMVTPKNRSVAGISNFTKKTPREAKNKRALAPIISTVVGPPWSIASGQDQYGTWADLHVKNITHRMRLIPAGSFVMGSNHNDNYSQPAHQVTLSRPFWLGDSQVTQAFWVAIMGSNPSHFIGNVQRPVETISWDDTQTMHARLKLLCPKFSPKLPTEAQWEYACRAGTTGDHAGEVDSIAWYDGNANGTTHPVKQKLPNAFGLYDMHGNVWEGCADWLGSYGGVAVDPSGPSTGSLRVFRGGSLSGNSSGCSSSFRKSVVPGLRWRNLGFRLACPTQ